MPAAKRVTPVDEAEDMRRSYIRVLIAWVLVLAGLFAFQEYFA